MWPHSVYQKVNSRIAWKLAILEYQLHRITIYHLKLYLYIDDVVKTFNTWLISRLSIFTLALAA